MIAMLSNRQTRELVRLKIFFILDFECLHQTLEIFPGSLC